MASNIKTALDFCEANNGELMPVQKLRYFSRDGIEASDVKGSNTGLYRVNALSNGI